MSSVIAFVGAGGKTTALYTLAMHHASNGKRCIITTTTHMQYPAAEFGPLYTDSSQVTFTNNKHICVCGLDCGEQNVTKSDGTLLSIHKMTGLPQEQFVQLYSLCDVLLVEADGARMLPLKVPASHEPVIPSGTTTVVVCAGLDSIGKPLSSVCFRSEYALSLLQQYAGWHTEDANRCVVPETVAQLLYYGYIAVLQKQKNREHTRIVALCNKADSYILKEQGQQCVDALHRLVAKHAAGSFGGSYITSLQKGESVYVQY
ncbi:MAG: putative selenium-dependent hydroxylase accessory protein YqeC [Treponema sp.]|nr:putative selenium-dependent hydroxylase accessory protein YqeC [Treponema sp.]